MEPLDTLGRPLHDLRISVTDRCNFRCTYCMPKEMFGRDYAFLPKDQVLSFEEIERAARAFVALGVEKLRITGGEPLVRRELPTLIRALAALRTRDGRELDLTLTTNGAALGALARPLADAGLRRVTVSLDSLDDAVFGAMNGVDFPVARVLDGVDAALEAGLTPVKVNMVVRRGVNESSVVPMARWARETGVILRFIEYMDVGHSNGWRLDEVVPAQELIDAVGGGVAGRAGRTRLPRRGRRSVAVPRRPRRVRHHLVGDAAVLPGLHACPAVGRRKAVHVPLRRRGSRRPGRPARWIERRGAGRVPRRHVARPGRPLLGAALAVHDRPAQGRDVRDGRLTAASRRAARSRPAARIRPQGYPQVDGVRGQGSDASRRFVDKRVDRPPTRPLP